MSLTRLFSLPILTKTQTYSIICRRFYPQKTVDISDPSVQKYLDYLILEHETLLAKENKDSFEVKRLREIKPIVDVVTQRMFLSDNIKSLRILKKDEADEEVKEMIKHESHIYQTRDREFDRQLRCALLDPYFTEGSVLLEVTAGEGEQAAQFPEELYQLYIKYAGYKDWDVERVSLENSSALGIDKASILISGLGVLQLMNLEAGIHEKIPGVNETDDYSQTSNVSVTILTQPNDAKWNVAPCELVIESGFPRNFGDYTASTEYTGVRITHIPTRFVVRCSEEDSCKKNEEIAKQTLRTILFQKMLDERMHDASSKGKSPNLSKNKPEKIRTYNFGKQVVIEHREIGDTQYSLKSIMQGEDELETLQNNILRVQRYKILMADIDAVLKKDKQEKIGDDDKEEEVYALF